MLPKPARVALVAALAALALHAAQASPDKGLPSAGTVITLEAVAGGFDAGIDIVSDEAYDEVKLSSPDPRLKDKLSTELFKTQVAPMRAKRLLVHLKPGALRQGPYLATLVATKGDTQIERDLWLAVPPVVLDPPASLVIEKVCDGIIMRDECVGLGERISSNRPQLWEPSQRRWLTGIRIIQKGEIEASRRTGGIVVVTVAPADIAPGTYPHIEYRTNFDLNGVFPLGTAKGKLSISADQLATPVTMDFEVHARTTRIVLALALVFGLLFGWLTRKFLKGRLDRTQEQQKTYVLLKLIEATLERSGDDDFRKQIGEVRAQATAALSAKTADETKTLNDAAQKRFLEIQDTMRLRRAALDQAFADTLALLQAHWQVPAALAEQISSTTSVVEALLLERPNNDFTREERTLDSAVAQVLDGAGTRVTRCAESLLAIDQLVGVLLPLLDAAATGALKVLARPAAAPEGVKPTASARQRLDGLRAALEYVHAACRWRGDTLRNLESLLSMQTARWDALLAGAQLPARPAWTLWLDAAHALGAKLGDMAADRGATPDALVGQAKALVLALKPAILAQLEPGERPAVEIQLTQAAYGEALAALALLRQPRPTVAESRAFEGRDVAPPSARKARSMAAASASGHATMMFGRSAETLPNSSSAPLPTPGFDAASLAILANASARRLEGTQTLLTLTYAAIIVIGGYFLFAEKWVGTPIDIAVAFFWAYATDIGSDAATTAARGLKK